MLVRWLLLVFVMLAIPSCAKVIPPTPAVPREPTTIAAPFGRTWDAVVDAFGARNIPIKTIERASGFVATDLLRATAADTALADCGMIFRGHIWPDHAIYNVIVRGDSLRSTVKATVSWSYTNSVQATVECASRGVWETEFERRVKDHAQLR